MNYKFIFYSIFLAIMVTGCASGYRKVESFNVGFEPINAVENQALTIQCSNIDIVGSINPSLERRLAKNSLVFIPVKVDNKSDKPFIISFQNIEMINDFMPVQMIEQDHYRRSLKQKFWPNLLYVPAAVLASYTKRESQQGAYIGTSYSFELNILSALITSWALLNSTRTIWVNHKTLKNITQNDLLNKTIAPDTTVHGFICVKAEKINHPMVRIRN
ncbi:MAG: hypothetical protein JXB49_04795 [Bacteroidales bacterium]|nr:hypothetical protein [Bacteroidales bacterium]